MANIHSSGIPFALALLILLGLLQISPATHASINAGLVILSKNEVQARSEGATRALARKDPVFSGDIVRTGSDSEASLRFDDGSVVSLDGNSELGIREYAYQAGDKPDSLLLELLNGSLRSLTGAISKVNRDAYRVKTPLATLSVRGTFFYANHDKLMQQLWVYVWKGEVGVSNEFGSVTLTRGQGASVRPGQAPVRTTALDGLAAILTPAQAGLTFVDELSDEQANGDNDQPGGTGTGGNQEPVAGASANAAVLGEEVVDVDIDTNPESADPDDTEEPRTDADDPTQNPLTDGSASARALEAELDAEFDTELEDPDADLSLDPGDGAVFAPGLGEDGQEIGSDRLIDNLP